MTKKTIGAAAVIGGGISGVQAALDLADCGYYVYLIESTSSVGGIMSQLDKTFPTNDCSMCIMSPKLVEVGRHINVELLTLSEVTSVSGEAGNFELEITVHPRYVDQDKCIACGLCAEKCPKKVPDGYEQGLTSRKAIYVKLAQAVPLKYAIDPEHCLYLTKGKCGNCAKVCPAGAVNFDDREEKKKLNVGAIVVAGGAVPFDPSEHDIYGYKKYPDIVTSIEFERILSASGPFGGHLVRPSDKKEPEKIAWLQCVGSRDEHIDGHGYCSSVCCTYAIKEAMLAKEHSRAPLDTAIFYIDLRTTGKDFEQFYNRAKNETGVRFIKSRVANIDPPDGNGRHVIRYIDESGIKIEEAFDIVVLSVGLNTTEKGRELAKRLGISLDHYGFADTDHFSPAETSRPGIYSSGTFGTPQDIPSSVIGSSAAAGLVGTVLPDVKHTLTKEKKVHPEKDLRGEPPRIGVFICRCGTNIASVVDVPAVVEYSEKLPHVVYSEENMFSCSQATQDRIAELIQEKGLNRVIVAACSPKTHDPLFQESLANAGINKYLFEMVNIRNQCSWVHKDNHEAATIKAEELVRMAVAKSFLLEPLAEPLLEVNQSALVIGGGIAGMTAAKTLAEQGYQTYIVEKNSRLGGQALSLDETWQGDSVQDYLSELTGAINSNDRIQVFTESVITKAEGFVGSFSTTLQNGQDSRVIGHGVTIIASGASELSPDQYLYGKDPRVITGLELQEKFINRERTLEDIKTVVFVQCVGSRIPERPYCSKVCCTQSIKSALKLKETSPDKNVFIVYRSMRPYGLREELYRKAREKGIAFIRYDHEQGLEVESGDNELLVSFSDRVLGRKMVIKTGLLVLASAITPEKKNPLAQMYKVSQNADGFFAEAHVKLRPVDFATDGVFVCGLAHAPKPIEESVVQAQAAAARAVTLLSKMTIPIAGTVAWVDADACSGCGVCVAVCPFSAPGINEKTGKAEINPTLCKGCGLCASSCRSGAIPLKGFDHNQIMSMVEEC